MNILFVITKFPIGGGTETVTRLLANEFALRKHNVCVCCFTVCKADIFVNEQVKILQFPKKGYSSQNIKFLNKILIDNSIDVIINQEYPVKTCILCHNARKGTNTKLISVFHFSLLMNPYARVGFLANILPIFLIYKLKKHRELRRRYLVHKYSDAFVFLSQRYVEQYKKLKPNKNLNKLYAIANPLEITTSELPNFEIKNKTIIFTARIRECEKQPSIVLEIWRLLHKKNPEWNLLFLGDGEDLHILKEKAKELPRVEFLGFQDLKPYFEKASILLQTSVKDFEGFPMTLIEAQKYACIPVAMNSYLSITDIIDNEKNGFITPYGDINAMAEKIQLLMNDEPLCKEIALNGISSVKKFNVKIIANEWEKLFCNLIQK
jgi:glycosyltransferase involved in cell wall biosynthesis